jgi:hypothetical protein
MAKRTRKIPKKTPNRSGAADETVGKRVVFDRETWQAIDLLARDSMKSFQELADEAFRDLLAKHDRPETLREALRDSLAAKVSPPAKRPARMPRRRAR